MRINIKERKAKFVWRLVEIEREVLVCQLNVKYGKRERKKTNRRRGCQNAVVVANV